MPKLDDAQLIAAIDAEAAACQEASQGILQTDRTRAIDRYKGVADAAPEGRSQVASRDLSDTIEWIMPSLCRVYLGGNEIGQFEPRGPEDEKPAEIETDVVNWMLEAKNDAYTQLSCAMKDALLLRNGYLICSWETRQDVMTETYVGLADEEAAILLDDDEVKIAEHREYTDPTEDVQPQEQGDADDLPSGAPAGTPVPNDRPRTLHDIKVERKRPDEFVRVESVPPDEVLVSHRHRWTSLADADFVQWRRRSTIGELRSQGYKIDDEESFSEYITPEQTARDRFGQYLPYDDETQEPTRRVIEVHETWLRIDLSGSGKQKLWRVCHIAGSMKILFKEEADVIPIAAMVPTIWPHSHFGVSIDDWVSDLADIKTSLMRQALDNTYLQNSNRVVVDVNRVNLDDLLINRPGGIVRTEGEPGTAVLPLVAPDVGASILGMLEYVDTVKEARTGVTRYSAGLDANSLNKTATGVQQIQAAANQRIELIARTMATGFKDLFLIMHALLSKHSTRPLQIKLHNQWVAIDPRSWTKRTDFSVSVGLGTGTPEQQITKIQLMLQWMGQASSMGLCGPNEFFNAGQEMLKAMGYKNTTKFLHEPQRDPQTGQPITPQHTDPIVQAEQEKGKVSVAIAQMKAQHDAQMAQMDMQAKNASEQARMQADIEVQKHKIATDAALAQEKGRMELELQALKHSREQETTLQVAALKAAADVEIARIKAAMGTGENMVQATSEMAGMPNAADVINSMKETMLAMAQHLTAPKQIIRDANGRAAGIAAMPQPSSGMQ